MSKTPVSLLQEILIKRGITPNYEFLDVLGACTPNQLFRYRVRVGNISVIGTAKTKQEAKHNAAKLALEKLDYYHDLDNVPNAAPKETNSICLLEKFCLLNKLPRPLFFFAGRIGPPTLQKSIYECKVGPEHKVQASHSQMQFAKFLAAEKMLSYLQKSNKNADNTNFVSESKINKRETAENNQAMSMNKFLKSDENKQISENIAKYRQLFTKLMTERKYTYDSLWKNITHTDTHAFQLILNRLDLNYTIHCEIIENIRILCITINSEPKYYTFGKGASLDEAMTYALFHMFEFLKMMTVNSKQ